MPCLNEPFSKTRLRSDDTVNSGLPCHWQHFHFLVSKYSSAGCVPGTMLLPGWVEVYSSFMRELWGSKTYRTRPLELHLYLQPSLSENFTPLVLTQSDCPQGYLWPHPSSQVCCWLCWIVRVPCEWGHVHARCLLHLGDAVSMEQRFIFLLYGKNKALSFFFTVTFGSLYLPFEQKVIQRDYYIRRYFFLAFLTCKVAKL